jgi:hypothetical protein
VTEPAVEVIGAKKLRSTLRKAGADMKDLTAVHREVGAIVAGAATPTTPRRTGRLASTVRAGATQTAAITRAGYARVPYAPPIHWGWPRRGIQARPWLSIAAQSTEPTWFARYEAGIAAILEKIKGA